MWYQRQEFLSWVSKHKYKHTLFFALDRFESHDIKSKELRKSKYMSLSFMIYRIIGIVNFMTKLITTIVETLARCSLEYKRMIVKFPSIVAVWAFLVMTAAPNFLTIFSIVQNLIQFPIWISSSVVRNIWIQVFIIIIRLLYFLILNHTW